MDPLTLTRELVAIDSINPSLVPGAAGEGAVADWLAVYLRRAGFDVEVQEVAPGRPNVIAVADGRNRGRRACCADTPTLWASTACARPSCLK